MMITTDTTQSSSPTAIADSPHINPHLGKEETDTVTNTTVAPRRTASDHHTRAPFPEVKVIPPGSATPTTPAPSAEVIGTAVLSADSRYRYLLSRTWGTGPCAVFIGLNPSRADAIQDDASTRRMIGFARSLGCGQLRLVNVYGWRSTTPTMLRRVTDPVGPDNDRWIRDTVAAADLVVAAWGTHASPIRVAAVLNLLRHRTVWSLGQTRDGHPRHPLYLPARTSLVRFADPRHDWTDWHPIPGHGLPEPLKERFCPTCGADDIRIDDHPEVDGTVAA